MKKRPKVKLWSKDVIRGANVVWLTCLDVYVAGDTDLSFKNVKYDGKNYASTPEHPQMHENLSAILKNTWFSGKSLKSGIFVS